MKLFKKEIRILMKLISIIIRGFGRRYQEEVYQRVVCVQEIKLVKLDDAMCYNLWESNDITWVHRGSIERVDREGEGILTMWNNKMFKCESYVEGKSFILVMEDYNYEGSDTIVKVLIMNTYALAPTRIVERS